MGFAAITTPSFPPRYIMLCAFLVQEPRRTPVRSLQELVERDGQVADADARCVIDGIGNRGSRTDNPQFTNALRAQRIDMRVLLVDPSHVDRADVGVAGHV